MAFGPGIHKNLNLTQAKDILDKKLGDGHNDAHDVAKLAAAYKAWGSQWQGKFDGFVQSAVQRGALDAPTANALLKALGTKALDVRDVKVVTAASQQLAVSANIKSQSASAQPFTYKVEVAAPDGSKQVLGMTTGTMLPGQSYSPQISWTPQTKGQHTVRVYLGGSLDDPNASVVVTKYNVH